MTDREDEIQARLDAADADLRAQNAWVDFTDHAHDDIAYLLERVREWRALAEEAIEEFDDARGYASAYFTGKWGYDVTSAQFAERRAALTERERE